MRNKRYSNIHTLFTRSVLFLLIAVLLCSTAFAAGIGSGTVSASELNVRASASTSASIIGSLSNGASVTVTEVLDGWYAIDYNGTTGYVKSDYISYTANDGSAAASTADAQTGTINANYVNIRSSANTSSSVVANVSKGTTVSVIGTEGSWYKLSYNGSTAYVRSDYVTLGSTDDTSDASSGQTGTINATYVRLRAGASTTSSILKTLDKGTTMTVTGSEGDWYKVNYNGTAGYVYKSYLSVGGDTSSDSSSGQTGTINATYVRFRGGASTSSSIIQTLDKGATMTVTGSEGDWYKVSYNGKDGYVYKKYLTVGGNESSSTSSVESASGTGTIRGTYVRVRSGPSTSSSILATVHTGTTMSITGTTGEWYQVSYNNQTGYVYKSYLVDSESYSAPADSGSAGEAIVAEAKKYLGVPYVYGGTSPSGFDCSGLVYYVYKQLGYSVYRTASAQYKNGTYVERSDLQPGDIIIFYNSGMSAIGHAGIYIGNGQFIHASSGGGKVQINELSGSYYNTHYYGARRVVS